MATPRLEYSPHKPFPRQQAFLDLDCTEAFYGGGAGPGKTDCLLMAALQYVHIPGYSALILRRDFPRLSLPGSIMERARSWLYHSDAKWNFQEKTFRFPSGAVLQFGYIDNPEDRFRYASSEFQFIGWDELTEFRLDDTEANPYLFMFSRLRKTIDLPVPLRVRSASNPGNIGHRWVKRRFVTQNAIDELLAGRPDTFYAGDNRDIAFVPALLDDNPAVDREAYIANLMHLPAVTRARLLKGDWSVQEHALIQADWLRYFGTRGGITVPLNRDGSQATVIEPHNLRRFITVDTAGTSKQLADERKKDKSSWSVAAVWDMATIQGKPWLFLRHIWRAKVGFTDLLAGLRKVHEEWGGKLYIENAHFGPAVADSLKNNRPTVQCELVSTATHQIKGEGGLPGKVERARTLFLALEEGRVFLPDANTSWLPDLEAEWLSWTGDEDEPADQIDVASHAAIVAERGNGGGWSAPTTNRIQGRKVW